MWRVWRREKRWLSGRCGGRQLRGRQLQGIDSFSGLVIEALLDEKDLIAGEAERDNQGFA